MHQNTILVVEDDLSFSRLLVKLFEDNNFRVYAGDNGLVALELYKTHHPHAILMDIDIPEKNGWEVLAEIYKNDKTIPVFLMTGKNTQEEDSLKGYGLGASVFIRKTTSPREIFAMVCNQLKLVNSFQEVIFFHDFRLNLSTLKLETPACEYNLTERQAKVLNLFFRNKESRIISQEEIHQLIWRSYDLRNQVMLKKAITEIRKFIESEGAKIESIYGQGYQLVFKKERNKNRKS